MATQNEQSRSECSDDQVVLNSPINDSDNVPLNPEVALNQAIEIDPQSISLLSDLWLVVSVITFVADVGSDILVATQYYSQKHYWNFGLTLGFALAASLVLQIFSLKWFQDDGRRRTCKLCVMHLFQMGPLLRYWSAIKLCWVSRHGRVLDARERFVTKWRDICMLKLLQAFIQSAPQAVFQLYVLCHRGSFVLEDDAMIIVASITSLVSVVWSLVCYSKALRDLRDHARDLPWLGFTFQVLWRGCMVTSRVIALVLFASHFQQWMLVAVVCHWFLMALWLSCQRTQFCVDESGQDHPCKEKMFNSIIAFVYIFCFFNTKEGMTRKRVVLYYSVILVENSLLISMWYPHRTLSTPMTYLALGTVWGGFVLGALFMTLYYRFYHHSHTFKGLFLRKRQFTLHGRKMYGLYFCCCCRIRKFNYGLYDCRDRNPVSRVQMAWPEGNPNGQEMHEVDVERFPRVNFNEINLHWDDDDIQVRPLNGVCQRGHAPGLHVYDEPNDIPDIIVTSASPLALSPRDSERLLSSTSEETEPEPSPECTCENAPQSPTGDSSFNKAKEKFASKLHSGKEIQEDEVFDDEEDIPKINYGTVSFGNRYSLVSSDCISLSSDSSLSSFTNSLNDLLDRMGVSTKPEVEDSDRKTSGADEGIFSDERDSPTKSTSDREVDPGAYQVKNVKNREMTEEEFEANQPLPGGPGNDVNSLDILESIMDAATLPKPVKTRLLSDESNGSGSTSSDERRHSCDEFPIDSYSANNSFGSEDDRKRHSFDISDLSARKSSKAAKKKGRNRKRVNKMVSFDNFVSTALKASQFGSLRKSFERLSKIQEDSEESGLLSDEVLRIISEPLPSLGNKVLQKSDKQVKSSPTGSSEFSPNETESDRTIEDHITKSGDAGLKSTNEKEAEQVVCLSKMDGIVISRDENLVTPKRMKDDTLEKMNMNGHLSTSDELGDDLETSTQHGVGVPNGKSEKEISQELFIDELTPSRFSTVRHSRESVPLACIEDFEDFDDLGSYDDDLDILSESDVRPKVTSPTSGHSVINRDLSGTESNDSRSSKEQMNVSYDSSCSSVFENLLYLESEQSNKRHTFDFGSNKQQGKVKRLGASYSQHALRTPGSPVWVHKAILKHRRRKPKVIAPKDTNGENTEGFIQEIRV